MPKAVRLYQYGGIEVLRVEEVPRPVPGPGEVLVAVKAAGINPGEGKIRQGLLHERWPATFPSGQGSDLAGIVEEVGPSVEGVVVGDEVIGFTNRRASHAELVLVGSSDLTPKPAGVPWEVAGSLFVAGATAWAAVRAVDLHPGDTVAVSGAAGGVGSIAVQLAALAGARVVGIASPTNHRWLRDHGVIPIAYGDDLATRLSALAGETPSGHLDAFIDTYGGDYVEVALRLGVPPGRIDTVVRFDAVARYGVKAEGNAAGARASVMAELAGLIADGRLEVPIAATYPLEKVQAAFRELEGGHARGKIVLLPSVPDPGS